MGDRQSEVFGPLEKLSYTTGDFIDIRLFRVQPQGDNAAWSMRNGHTYSDRARCFDAADPAKPRQFIHPVMDPHYDKPSMISETTFCRPGRYRSSAAFFAAYGALQESDGIVHFALDGSRWAVKPGFWMQPWTLTPAMMGQFPAAALIYRRGLVSRARCWRREANKATCSTEGTPAQDAALDELRLADVPVALR
jgi:hypothetical protein